LGPKLSYKQKDGPLLKKAGRAKVEVMCTPYSMLVSQYERNKKKIIVLEFRK
jgi:phage terminase small subunit